MACDFYQVVCDTHYKTQVDFCANTPHLSQNALNWFFLIFWIQYIILNSFLQEDWAENVWIANENRETRFVADA